MMFKKGELVLRDIIFMIIMFGGIMALMSVFVFDMSAEYENTNMSAEYGNLTLSGLGDNVIEDINGSVAEMRSATDSATGSDDNLLGSFNSVTGIINGAGTILKIVFTSPVLVGDYLTILLDSLGVPSLIANIIGFVIILLLYTLIIFVLISALLRGGGRV